MAVQHHHLIKNKQQLLDSGLLNEVLQGKQQLYEDLPAIPIDAYQNGLKKMRIRYRKIIGQSLNTSCAKAGSTSEISVKLHWG